MTRLFEVAFLVHIVFNSILNIVKITVYEDGKNYILLKINGKSQKNKGTKQAIRSKSDKHQLTSVVIFIRNSNTITSSCCLVGNGNLESLPNTSYNYEKTCVLHNS